MIPHVLFLFAPAGQAADSRGMFVFFFQMALIAAIIYFFLFRPRMQQEKRQRERLSQLKRGDEIVTAGGIIGEVVHLKDDRVTVKSGESRLVIQRDRIAEVRSPGGTAESSQISKRATTDSGASGAAVS